MPKYIAVVGLDYRNNKTGKPIRVEAGQEVHNLGHRSMEEELRAGNIRLAEEPDKTGEAQ